MPLHINTWTPSASWTPSTPKKSKSIEEGQYSLEGEKWTPSHTVNRHLRCAAGVCPLRERNEGTCNQRLFFAEGLNRAARPLVEHRIPEPLLLVKFLQLSVIRIAIPGLSPK